MTGDEAGKRLGSKRGIRGARSARLSGILLLHMSILASWQDGAAAEVRFDAREPESLYSISSEGITDCHFGEKSEADPIVFCWTPAGESDESGSAIHSDPNNYTVPLPAAPMVAEAGINGQRAVLFQYGDWMELTNELVSVAEDDHSITMIFRPDYYSGVDRGALWSFNRGSATERRNAHMVFLQPDGRVQFYNGHDDYRSFHDIGVVEFGRPYVLTVSVDRANASVTTYLAELNTTGAIESHDLSMSVPDDLLVGSIGMEYDGRDPSDFASVGIGEVSFATRAITPEDFEQELADYRDRWQEPLSLVEPLFHLDAADAITLHDMPCPSYELSGSLDPDKFTGQLPMEVGCWHDKAAYYRGPNGDGGLEPGDSANRPELIDMASETAEMPMRGVRMGPGRYFTQDELAAVGEATHAVYVVFTPESSEIFSPACDGQEVLYGFSEYGGLANGYFMAIGADGELVHYSDETGYTSLDSSDGGSYAIGRDKTYLLAVHIGDTGGVEETLRARLYDVSERTDGGFLPVLSPVAEVRRDEFGNDGDPANDYGDFVPEQLTGFTIGQEWDYYHRASDHFCGSIHEQLVYHGDVTSLHSSIAKYLITNWRR